MEKKMRYVGKENAPIDPCIVQEIADLNDMGIKTLASCCGHNKSGRGGMIVVIDEDIPRMVALEYVTNGTYRSDLLEVGKIYIPFKAKSICKCKNRGKRIKT